MEKQNYKAILADFNTYLLIQFNYRKPMVKITNTNSGVNLSVNRKFVDLYIRLIDVELGRRSKGTIVIAGIGFFKMRKGHGSSFLSFLYGIALKYGYSYVEIESANENSSAFARRYGFEEIEKEEFNGFILSSDYRISIYELKHRIHRYD